MADNSDIARMLSLLSANLMAEVETHNAGNWENEDTIRLYECLQTAIYETQIKQIIPAAFPLSILLLLPFLTCLFPHAVVLLISPHFLTAL